MAPLPHVHIKMYAESKALLTLEGKLLGKVSAQTFPFRQIYRLGIVPFSFDNLLSDHHTALSLLYPLSFLSLCVQLVEFGGLAFSKAVSWLLHVDTYVCMQSRIGLVSAKQVKADGWESFFLWLTVVSPSSSDAARVVSLVLCRSFFSAHSPPGTL